MTPSLTQAISEALDARELIKISVLQNCADDPRALAEMVAETHPFSGRTGHRQKNCIVQRRKRR